MHGPTCVFWANLTPFSLQAAAHAEAAAAQIGRLEAAAAGHAAGVAAVRRRSTAALGASLAANVLAVLGIVISRARL